MVSKSFERLAISTWAALVTSGSAIPGFSQVLDQAPQPSLSATDDAGVDLRGGLPVKNMGQLTIGDINNPAFSYGILDTSGGTSNTITQGIEYHNCASTTSSGGVVPGCIYDGYSFNLGGQSDAYMVSPHYPTDAPTGFTEQGSLVSGSSLIRKDGSIWQFGNGGLTLSSGNPYNLQGFVASITKADGEVLTYNYSVGELRSIVSSTGYMLHLEANRAPYYSTNGISTMGPDRPQKVTLINLAVDFCDPFAISCTNLTKTWPTLTYSGSDASTVSVVDSMGRLRQRVKTGTGQYQMVSPEGVWFEYAIQGWYNPKPSGATGVYPCDSRSHVLWIRNAEGQTNYSFVKNTSCRGGRSVLSGIATGPDGYVQAWDGTGFVDGLQRKTAYSIAEYKNFFGSAETQVTSITRQEGNTFIFEYDRGWNLKSTTATSKDKAQSISASANYNISCSLATAKTCNKPDYTIDARGKRTEYTYAPEHGGVLSKTLPPDSNGIRPQVRYNYLQISPKFKTATGQLVDASPIWKLSSQSTCLTLANCQGTDDEIVTTYKYENNNLLMTSVAKVTGSGKAISKIDNIYDDIGNLISVDGPAQGAQDVSYYFYNSDRELIGEISPDPDGAGGPLPRPAKRMTYNRDGQLTKTEFGTVTQVTADALQNAMSVFRSSETSYDGLGRRSGQRIIANSVPLALTNYTYDVRGHLLCTAVRMNPAVYGSLPASACELGAEGSEGPDRVTRNSYDAAGQLIQVRKAVGTPLEQVEVTYSYSSNGKQEYVIDANGNRARKTYDGYDRLFQWQFPAQASVSGFNSATQANALATAGAVNIADYEEYGYDAHGNRTSLRKRDSQLLTYQYDDLNRVFQKTVPASASGAAGYAVFYGYDLRSLQTYARFGNAAGPGVTSAYDASGSLVSSTTTLGGVSRTLTSEYDVDGNRTRLTYPDGANVSFLYDGLDRMTAVRDPSGNDLTIMTYYANGGRGWRGYGANGTGYSYDGAQRLSGYNLQRNQAGTIVGDVTGLSYNPASQITQQNRSSDAYAWTGAVNVDRSYSTNGLNQYTSAGSSNFSYDANGNLTSDGGATYTYDAENRLVSARGGRTANLSYDPLGRLWQVDNGSVGTRFVYDGDALVAEYDAGNTLLDRYVHASGVDEPVLWYHGANSSPFQLFADHQGSIISITQQGWSLAAINTYDEYGIPGASNAGRFQYTGQIWIPELGLYHYKARFYSPTLGRFLQTDPIGYDDQFNLYAYVANDPVNKTDPSGKDSWVVSRPSGYLGTDHMFVVVADEAGSAPTARFSYGPTEGSFVEKLTGRTDLVSQTNSRSITDRTDAAAWAATSNPKAAAAAGISMVRIQSSDAAVVKSGNATDRALGTNERPGGTSYSPLGPNSNSAAYAVADRAVTSEGGRVGSQPVTGSAHPGGGAYRSVEAIVQRVCGADKCQN